MFLGFLDYLVNFYVEKKSERKIQENSQGDLYASKKPKPEEKKKNKKFHQTASSKASPPTPAKHPLHGSSLQPNSTRWQASNPHPYPY